jgi:hypothetical protein
MSEEKKDTQSGQVKEQGQNSKQQPPTPTREWIHISPYPIELLSRKADDSKK